MSRWTRRWTQAAAAGAVAAGTVLIPTLAMMEGIVRQSAPPGRDYAAARASVTVMYQAGVPILAGTDANAEAGGPAMISHGSSLHHELELLVDAGLTTVDALRAATSRPARYFGLRRPRRGRTRAPGRPRADRRRPAAGHQGHPVDPPRLVRRSRGQPCWP